MNGHQFVEARHNGPSRCGTSRTRSGCLVDGSGCGASGRASGFSGGAGILQFGTAHDAGLECRSGLDSSYLTREEAERLHELAGVGDGFYSAVPYRLPSSRYHKSPHALWGTLPSLYIDSRPVTSLHPYLGEQSLNGEPPVQPQNRLAESIYVIDTELRKQQERERITRSLYPHKRPGLHLISGIGTMRVAELSAQRPPLPSAMELRHLLATSSFRAPVSPLNFIYRNKFSNRIYYEGIL